MKRLFAVIVLLALAFTVSAEPLTGFWGIRFGSSVRDTEVALSSKGITGASRRGDGSGDTLLAENVTFAGRKTDIVFYFFNDMFYRSVVVITTDKYQLFDEYGKIKKDLRSKYGTPTSDIEKYKYPYKKGDGDEIMAVRVGAAEIYTFWNFDLDNHIIVATRYDKSTDSYQIILGYTDQIIEAQKNNDKNVLDDL